MDRKTVGEISIQKAFNKKWWDSNRSSKIKGTGTGALLDTWKKTYSDTPGGFSTAEIAATRKAGEPLKKSLLEAQKLCGTSQPDDLAGIKKMIGLLETYESLLEDREKTIKSLSDLLGQSISAYNDAKPGLLEAGKDLAEVDKRIKSAAEALEKPLDGNQKQDLGRLLGVIDSDLEKLLGRIGQVMGKPNDIDSKAKGAFEGARKDKGMRPNFERYDAMKAGFFEIGDRLYQQVQSRIVDVKEMIADVSDSSTIETTVKMLNEFTEIVKSGTCDEFVYILDQAKDWLPRLIVAKRQPETVNQETIRGLMLLEEILVQSTRMALTIDGQIARMAKQSTKAASRFKQDPTVQKALQTFNDNVKRRLEERAKAMKMLPVLQKETREVLEAAL